MRHPKALGAAAALALVAIAALGAGSASAMSFCNVEATECPSANRYESGTELAAEPNSGTTVVLSSSFKTITCTSFKLMVKTKAATGSPLPIEVTTAEFGGCTDQLGNATTVKATGLAWKGSAAWTSGPNASLTIENPVIEYTSVAEFCKYGAAKIQWSFTGGNPFGIQFLNALEKLIGSGPLCSPLLEITAGLRGVPTYYGHGTVTKVYASAA